MIESGDPWWWIAGVVAFYIAVFGVAVVIVGGFVRDGLRVVWRARVGSRRSGDVGGKR